MIDWEIMIIILAFNGRFKCFYRHERLNLDFKGFKRVGYF